MSYYVIRIHSAVRKEVGFVSRQEQFLGIDQTIGTSVPPKSTAKAVQLVVKTMDFN